MERKERIIYFDLLRIVAAIFVIQLHIAAPGINTLDYNNTQWNIHVLYDGISRWSVGIFIMISGSLFLRRDITIETLLKKYIFRIFIAFIVWSFVFSLVYNMLAGFSFKSFVYDFVKGHFHLWFLYMVVGLYLIVPFLRKIVIDEKTTKYFLVLACIFGFVLPEATSIIKVISEKLGKQAQSIVDQTHLYFVMGFSGFFILGYYLSKKNISIKTEMIIYVLGVIGFCFTVLGSVILTQFKKEPVDVLFENNTVNVLLEVVSIFTLFKQRISKIQFKESTKKAIISLSKYSFGVYLVHPLFILFLKNVLKIQCSSFNPLFSIPLITLLVGCLSFATSAVLNRIPVIKKYLV